MDKDNKEIIERITEKEYNTFPNSEEDITFLMEFLEKTGYVEGEKFTDKISENKLAAELNQALVVRQINTINNEILGSEKTNISRVQRCLLWGYPRAEKFIEFLQQKKFIEKKENDWNYTVIHNNFSLSDLEEWIRD